MSRYKPTKDTLLDKFPGITMSPFKITQLPKLSGVRGLSTQEIKDDLRELHPPSDANDTDSDCSVLSDDILDSVYPVQPRTAPKTALQQHDYLTSTQNLTTEDAMFVIKDIAKTHSELMEKERQREEWEIQSEAYQQSLAMETEQFASTRREHENYLKLLQGLYARSIRLYTSHNRQNALLFHVHDALQKLRESEQRVAMECGKLKAQLATAKHAGRDGKASQVQGDNSRAPVLVVHLEKAGVDVLLQEGMTLYTPMGEGSITEILPQSNKVVVQLPYGVMYAHLPRVVGWVHTAQPVADLRGVVAPAESVHGVQQRFLSALHERLGMPQRDAGAIRTLLTQLHRGEEEAGATTDHDDASHDGSDAGAGSSSASLPGADSTSAPAPAQSQQDATSDMDVDGAEAESGDEAGTGHHTRAAGPARRVAETTSSSSAVADKDSVRPNFPVPVPANQGPNVRATIKKALENEVLWNYSQVLLDSLPLAFAPASSLSHVLAENHFALDSASATRLGDIEFQTQALQTVYASYPQHSSNAGGVGEHSTAAEANGAPLGASGHLAWYGDLNHLSKAVDGLDEEIRALQAEQAARMCEVEAVRNQGARLTTEAANIRLNMFTRRLAHRTNLSNRGIVLPVAAPSQSQSSKSRANKSNSQNHSNSGSTGNINSLLSAAESGNGNGGSAGALAMLIAAGESRSSRSKRSATATATATAAGETDGFARKSQLLRAAADSPAHSLAEEASNRRRTTGAAANRDKDKDKEEAQTQPAAGNKRRAPASSSRRGGDDADPEPSVGGAVEGEAEGNDSESEASKAADAAAPGTSNGGGGAAAAKKKPKRRRY